MKLIHFFTQNYTENYYMQKKAEYSIILMLISMLAMVSIMILESILVSATPLKLISSVLFLLAFVGLLFLIRSGAYELAINLLIMASLLRAMMIYFYPTPFQFYVMGVLSLLTISVLYIKTYQILMTGLAYLALYSYKVPVMYHLVSTKAIHERAFTQSIYSIILLCAVGAMLYFLTRLVNREIRESETLKNYAHQDSLTKLYNRRKISMVYDTLAMPVTAVIMDIDFFKQINDTYGHTIGDEVLIGLSNLLKEVFLDGHIARWGGEEFLILMPITNCEEKVRLFMTRLADTHFVNEISLTMSMGLASQYSGESLTDLVRRADQGLYEAKKRGRNQYVHVG